MASTIAVAVAGAVFYILYSNVSGFLKNLAAAKRSGLPYIIVPVNIYNSAWLMTHKIWVRFFSWLPASWSEKWLPYLIPDWVWDDQFEPFEQKGDVFLQVSPGSVQVWLANAEALHQVTSRREAFPKPLESYRILDIFGRNIITTEGAEWKQHRKITAPGFNEKNNVLVFAESIKQAQGMLLKWSGSGGKTLNDVPTDTMRLTLHIISRIGFGVSLLWPGEKPDEKASTRDAVFSSNEPPEGHTMSFEHALETLLERMLWVLLTPKWILKRLPFDSSSKAYDSYINWKLYMSELFSQKIEEAREGHQSEGLDIMGMLVRSSYSDSKTRRLSPGSTEKGEVDKPILSDSDILGNAFVMIVAGHETTANSIHFSLMELAINPRAQRLLHKEVQSIFGDEPPEAWDYESNINALLGGVVGAVMNEQLRLMPPVIAIPKQVSKAQDQVIVLDGKKILLPAGARIALNTVAVHRNPKYWPTQPSQISDRSNDLYDFRPERWLVKTTADGKQHVDSGLEAEGDDEFGGFTGSDTSASLFRPARGAYLPFSDGPRSCLGRRLAQVKVLSVLSVIFQKYSIELAVDEWATDEEVAKMTPEEKKAVYKKAQEKARQTIRRSTSLITLKLHEDPAYIPVRLVKKGDERFINIVD
ncbi:cytochrome P450 [Drepanopeziza brunnea f. sp. 'multigermtubi' MB_m1]|uniref:Cytochrome P450 n=1 Tax=Marssonina brunnea f. sp. multigermtubi (strain MB_m1) TaxID=1072389 RepID=K1WVQ3_MARBU|nr:cytochrome P450 [Drepanopeziza brunnea f. sp. 'multigermtubi' MB_m1]EKD16552.1 cytochrome P450 [Drepanopeziza brunnea f. sp. 'multigermtubi' MB_m1]